MDVLSPYLSLPSVILIDSQFHGESCPRLDVKLNYSQAYLIIVINW